MSHLAKDMEKSSEEWERWCAWEGCEKQTLPGEWSRLPAFRYTTLPVILPPTHRTEWCKRVVTLSLQKSTSESK